MPAAAPQEPSIRACFEAEQSGAADLSGLITVTFTYSPSGAVSTAQLTSSTASPSLEACVVDLLTGLTFELPQDTRGVLSTSSSFSIRFPENIPSIETILSEAEEAAHTPLFPDTGMNIGIGGLIGARGLGSESGGLGLSGGETSARGPAVSLGEVTVSGSLGEDHIRDVVHRHMDPLRACYTRELARDPSVQGELAVQFRIRADGSVSKPRLKDATVTSEEVGACVAGHVSRFQFPSPEGGGRVTVTLPFVFAPE